MWKSEWQRVEVEPKPQSSEQSLLAVCFDGFAVVVLGQQKLLFVCLCHVCCFGLGFGFGQEAKGPPVGISLGLKTLWRWVSVSRLLN